MTSITTSRSLYAPDLRGALRRFSPGLVLCGALAATAMELGRTAWLQSHGFSALTLALVLGMVIGNTVYSRFAESNGAGVNFSKQKLLRLGVVLYGLRLTMQDIAHVGVAGVLIDALVLGSTFALACLIGIRWLRLDHRTAMLIGAGSSICGAAAVMATEPVVRARSEQVTVAVATVVLFGPLAIFLYPVLFELNQHWHWIGGGPSGFGVYAGSTIHEVAQVVAAANSTVPAAADAAVIAKMVRVMMLAPFLMALSTWLARKETRRTSSHAHAARPEIDNGNSTKTRLSSVPWFAFAFVGVALVNSLHILPARGVAVATEIDGALLAMAMAALGLTTNIGALRKVGIKPLLLALALFVWLVVGGSLINRWVPAVLG